MRYKMIPSLVAAGHQATASAFPIVARCDLFWPEHAPDSASNHQYLFINDTLVAPIWDSTNNVTSRYVWIPPGTWQDAWSGDTVSGPTNISVSQPYERVPLYHRQGGLMVLVSEPSLRVHRQDWSELTLEAFPAADVAQTTHRTVAERGADVHAAKTHVVMHTDGAGHVRVDINQAVARAWVVRLHLRPGQRVGAARLDAQALGEAAVTHIAPTARADFMPFGGKGAAPAPGAGFVAELRIPASASASLRTLDVDIL